MFERGVQHSGRANGTKGTQEKTRERAREGLGTTHRTTHVLHVASWLSVYVRNKIISRTPRTVRLFGRGGWWLTDRLSLRKSRQPDLLCKFCSHISCTTQVYADCAGKLAVIRKLIRLSDLWRIRAPSSFECYFSVSSNMILVL